MKKEDIERAFNKWRDSLKIMWCSMECDLKGWQAAIEFMEQRECEGCKYLFANPNNIDQEPCNVCCRNWKDQFEHFEEREK